MINNRKGLSEVVTTVLIILLVLSAVAIMASYILNAVNKGGAEVGGSAECTLLQLYPTECRYTKVAGTGGAADTYILDVKATKRGSNINVKDLNVLLQDANTRDIKSKLATSKPNFLETSTVYSESGLTTKRYSSAQVTVTLVPEGGTATTTCNPSKTVDCIEA